METPSFLDYGCVPFVAGELLCSTIIVRGYYSNWKPYE
jgi:hypothetical protein